MNPKTSRLVGIVSIVIVALAFFAVPRAHTKQQKTEPADGAVLSAVPQHVELWFDEKPDVSVSKIELGGAPWPRGWRRLHVVVLGETFSPSMKAIHRRSLATEVRAVAGRDCSSATHPDRTGV